MFTSFDRRNSFTGKFFNGIAQHYEGPARVFSFLQYDHWHRFLVSRLDLTPQSRVLDMCTGTGLVAMRIAEKSSCDVVGLDLSEQMLAQARGNIAARGLDSLVGLVRGRAEGLPFEDDSFDVVVFTYLLRYVEDAQATITELGRVLKPGGQMASLEFYVPQGPVLHPLWLFHTRLIMPLGTRFLKSGWREVGAFLGPSISDFYRRNSLEDLGRMWRRANIENIQLKKLSLGGAVVIWGRKQANHEE